MCVYSALSIMYVNDILFSVCVQTCVHFGMCVCEMQSVHRFPSPFPPDVAQPTPQCLLIPSAQSLSPREIFPGPSAVGYHPHYVRQPQGVCGCSVQVK